MKILTPFWIQFDYLGLHLEKLCWVLVCLENLKITVGQKQHIPASQSHREKGIKRAAVVAHRATKHRLRLGIILLYAFL